MATTTSEARRTLQNFQMVESLFVDFRARIYEEVNRLRQWDSAA